MDGEESVVLTLVGTLVCGIPMQTRKSDVVQR